MLNIVAESPSGATAHIKRSVVFDFTPGTVLLDVTDPSNDDNGPGNYAYPTSTDFHAGAFDLLEFQVILSPDGQTTTFKAKIRDLSPTFGSPLGAQLVNVRPGPRRRSPPASFWRLPSRGLRLEPPARSARFGQRFPRRARHDSHDLDLGRQISLHVRPRPRSSAPCLARAGRSPSVLTGRDGFSPRPGVASPRPADMCSASARR